MMVAVQLLGGGLLLYFGAEWFVAGASRLALALRIPQVIVGLTVVAYGTSAPEVIVGVEAALSGHGDVAMGNVIGSNVANIGLILGVAALVKPASVDGTLRRRELPMLLLSTALLPLLALDGAVQPLEAAGLLLVAAGYSAWMVRAARVAAVVAVARLDTIAAAGASEAAGAPSGSKTRSAVIAVLGLGVLLVGGQLFVGGAVGMARAFGMSDRLVGLTIVAVGTSLPELVTSVIAALRGHSDIAVGNVVGSNIFNVYLCLGAAAAVAPVSASLSALAFDLGALALLTIAGATFIRTERVITRVEGAIAVSLYAAFIVVTLLRG